MGMLTTHEYPYKLNRMEHHAAHQAAQAVADGLRAEMARKRKTNAEMAVALDRTPGTIGRKLNGDTDMTVTEMFAAAEWLEIDPRKLLPEQPANSDERAAA